MLEITELHIARGEARGRRMKAERILFALLLFQLLSTPEALMPNSDPGARPYLPENSRFAMLDDVRILANGLLQLGHGLKDFVQKTKNQINQIFEKINIFDRSFFELSQQTQAIQSDEEELKKTTVFLRGTNEELKTISQDIKAKLDSILENRTVLETKVEGLEEKLDKLSQTKQELAELKEIAGLKVLVEEQDKNLKSLINIIREQEHQLEQQRTQIHRLEHKLDTTIDQGSLNDPEHQSQPPYPQHFHQLPGDSTALLADYTGVPSNCDEIYSNGKNGSGVTLVKPNGYGASYVYCHITAEGGWTVIQQRIDGSVDFDQPWENYERGFGALEGEFWLGLETVHRLTQAGGHTLRVEVEVVKNESRFVEYAFSLGGKETGYALRLSGLLRGNLTDAMREQAGSRFSTRDRDNDLLDDINCAEDYSGGWWFSNCGDANLNGRYSKTRLKGKVERRKGLFWSNWKGRFHVVKSTRMMVRAAGTGSLAEAEESE
ncbi:angiopoietin-related protein 3 [Callorhinchus milii]|uniref:angiopoietin-related protein 3 n=1 Tax=Callorhinchus milii TaxID=7868 RepID=UPI001C3F95A0|nr:angiopoietin-related protein 3 [Callorhinchus milii]